jgi:hypothetical protein
MSLGCLKGEHMPFIPPRVGVASGVPYTALAPTAVDADIHRPVPLLLVWHGTLPPRTERACATALAMTGVPAWRVFLGKICDPAPVAAELRALLGLGDVPLALAGVAEGATAVLEVLARGTVPVAAAAAVSPVLLGDLEAARPGPAGHGAAASTARPGDPRSGIAAIAAADPALLLVAGRSDAARVGTMGEALRTRGASRVEVAALRMGGALAAEPGLEPAPPTAEAVRVDGVLTEWFRERFALAPRPAAPSLIRLPGRPSGSEDLVLHGHDTGAHAVDVAHGRR